MFFALFLFFLKTSKCRGLSNKSRSRWSGWRTLLCEVIQGLMSRYFLDCCSHLQSQSWVTAVSKFKPTGWAREIVPARHFFYGTAGRNLIHHFPWLKTQYTVILGYKGGWKMWSPALRSGGDEGGRGVKGVNQQSAVCAHIQLASFVISGAHPSPRSL